MLMKNVCLWVIAKLPQQIGVRRSKIQVLWYRFEMSYCWFRCIEKWEGGVGSVLKVKLKSHNGLLLLSVQILATHASF